MLAEYEEHRAGRLDLLKTVDDRGKGAVNACGDETSAPWAATYVRYMDQAVMPLAVGCFRHVYELAGMLADQDLTDESRWSPPRVILDGAPRTFQPTYGRYLLGIARSGERVVMLVALGEELGVLLQVEPMSRPIVLFIGSTLGFRELDVDRLAELHVSSASAGRKAPRKRPVVAAATQVHHRRIVLGEEFETGDGPAVPEVVRLCFEALAERTIDEARRCLGGRARGVSFVRPTLWAIYRLGLRGSLDPCGRIGELHRQLSEVDPTFRLGASQLADAVKLLEKTGCCLILRMSRRIWKIRVVGLSDPRSQLHRSLCKETGGRFLFGRAANAGTVGLRHRPSTACGASTRGSAPSRSSQGAASGEAVPTGEDLAALVEAHKQMAVLTAERDDLRREVDELRGQVVALERRSGASARMSGASARMSGASPRKASPGGPEVSEGPKAETGRRAVPVAGREQRRSERNGESTDESDSRGRSLAEVPTEPEGNGLRDNSEAVARVESAIKGLVVVLSEAVDGAAKVDLFRSRVAALRELVAGRGSAWPPGVGPGSAATRAPPGACPRRVHAVRPCTTISAEVVSLILDRARR